jgi:hypothetical protein
MYWIDLAYDTYKEPDVVKAIIKLRVLYHFETILSD